jgi:hypothetical protein
MLPATRWTQQSVSSSMYYFIYIAYALTCIEGHPNPRYNRKRCYLGTHN